jgi:hypothetical protein
MDGAALLLTVVDEGKLALDEAISNVPPGFAASRPDHCASCFPYRRWGA